MKEAKAKGTPFYIHLLDQIRQSHLSFDFESRLEMVFIGVDDGVFIERPCVCVDGVWLRASRSGMERSTGNRPCGSGRSFCVCSWECTRAFDFQTPIGSALLQTVGTVVILCFGVLWDLGMGQSGGSWNETSVAIG